MRFIVVIILKDYINYFLDEYNLKSDINNDIVELLLNLNYNEKNIKDNDNEHIKTLLIKILFVETNSNYILI